MPAPRAIGTGRAAHEAHRLRTAIQLVAGAGSAALGVWMLAGPAGASSW